MTDACKAIAKLTRYPSRPGLRDGTPSMWAIAPPQRG